MNFNGLNELISEDIISDEEDSNAANLLKLQQISEFNQRGENFDFANQPFYSTAFKNDKNHGSLQNLLKSNIKNSTGDQQPLRKYYQPFVKEKPSGMRMEAVNLGHKRFVDVDKNSEKQRTVTIKPKIRPLSNSENFYNLYEEIDDEELGETFAENLMDNTELENKINDTLLDMLQDNMLETCSKTANIRFEENQTEDILKFITISPSKISDKTISLKVKGKTCRSNLPLNKTEIRIIKRIINQEKILDRKDDFYKNVYYDPESDTNIRYEVRQQSFKECDSHSADPHSKLEKINLKSNQRMLENKGRTIKNERNSVWNKVTRSKFGRISRPQRHISRDYKRLKHSTEMNNDTDIRVNSEGSNNCGIVDDLSMLLDSGQEKNEQNVYGPMKSNTTQFSSLSKCPTCGKVYSGYRRMAIHFQKFPNHKNENLLKQLLKNEMKKSNENRLTESLLTNADANPSDDNPEGNRKFNQRIKPQSSKNSSLRIKELLSHFEAEEIVKFAAPIVAEVLNSWEYLLMRTKQKRNCGETLFLSIIEEIRIILKQVRTLTSHTLKPLIAENDSTSNKFKIKENDIMQYVLGISPGTYVISDADRFPNVEQTTDKEISASATPPNVSIIETDSNRSTELLDAIIAECLEEDLPQSETTTTLDTIPLLDHNDLTISENNTALDSKQLLDTTSLTISEIPVISINNEVNPTGLPIQYVVSDVANLTTGIIDDSTSNSSLFNQECSNNTEFTLNSTLPLAEYSLENNTSATNGSSLTSQSHAFSKIHP